MKKWLIGWICYGLAGAHPADPNLLLAKYTLYGKDAIISSPNVETENTGRGWIGSDLLLSGSNSTIMYGPLKVGGVFQAQGGSYYGSMDVLGNITNSGGSPVFGQASNGPDTVRYNGSLSSYSGTPVLLSGQAKVDIPQFPTYVVNDAPGQNCTLTGSTWSGAQCPVAGQSGSVALPAGRYGDVVISSGAKAVLGAGNYEFSSLTIYDTLLVDKAAKSMCRILVKGNFALKQTGVGAVLTTTPGDLGRVLIYVTGTQVETQQGQTLKSTLIAPNATVALNPNFKVYGQVLAMQVNLSNSFNGSNGAFVPFQPLGISYQGADTIYENQGSPLLYSDNSRLVQFPVQLASPFASEVRVQFRLIPSRTLSPVIMGAVADLDSSSARGAFASGTLIFAPGQTSPQALPKLWMNDDPYFENAKHFDLELWGATPADSVQVEGADTLTGKALWPLVLISDDPLNHKPTDLVLSSQSLDENQAKGSFVAKMSTVDADLGQQYAYSLISGAGFRISHDTLYSDSVFDYETSPHLLNLSIKVQDYANGQVLYEGTDSSFLVKNLQIQLQNLNDNAPVSKPDTMALIEGGTQTLLLNSVTTLLANDSDLDSLGTLKSVQILQAPWHGQLTMDTLGHVRYVHNDSENFKDSALIVVQDSMYRSAQWKDSSWLYFQISPVNDHSPTKLKALGDTVLWEDFQNIISYDFKNCYTDLDQDSLRVTLDGTSGPIDLAWKGDHFEIRSQADSNGWAKVVLRISDGLLSHDILDTLTIQILPVNDAPHLSVKSLSVPEDTSFVGWNLGSGQMLVQPANEQSQITHFKLISHGNGALYSVQPALDSLGHLTFQSAPDSNGLDTLKILLKDDGGVLRGGVDSAWLLLPIEVRPVNDKPSYLKGIDTLQFPEDSGALVIPWAQGLRAGPANEQSQKLRFKMLQSSSSLWKTQPYLDSLGQLHLESAADANGSQWIYFRLMDNGGTADGGIDSTLLDSLWIHIIPVNDLPRWNQFKLFKQENAPDQALLDSAELNGLHLALPSQTWMAKDVDGDSLWIIGADSLVQWDPKGYLKLRPGIRLDYEKQKSYTLHLAAVAGIDTVWNDVQFQVLNEIEQTQINVEKSWIGSVEYGSSSDSIWTNQLKIRVAWNIGQLYRDTLDYNLVNVQENRIDTTWLNPTKDSAGYDQVIVRVNQKAPLIRLEDSTMKRWGNVYYLNKVNPQLTLHLERMDRNLNWQKMDTTLSTDWGEGRHTHHLDIKDIYGNLSSWSADFVVDTTAPKVKIQSPTNRQKLGSALVPVQWSVDGRIQDSLLSQSLSLGVDTVVRNYMDSAGNKGADTVLVTLDLPEGKGELSLLDLIVHDGPDLQNLAIERAELSGHVLDPEQIFSLSLVDSSGSQGRELFYGTKTQSIESPGQSLITLEKQGHLGVDLALNLPLNGGLDASGNSRDGLCADQSPMWEQGIQAMTMEIYDQSGQFVLSWNPMIKPLVFPSSKWQDDQGNYQLRLELLPADGQLRSERGQRWATGVYLIRLNVRSYSKGINCREGQKTQWFKYHRMVKIGFNRQSNSNP